MSRNVMHRLNRFFNIFNPHVYTWMLILAAVLLIFVLINKKVEIAEIVMLFLCEVGSMISVMRHCPKTLTLFQETIEFEDYVNMRPRHRHSSGFHWLKVSYCVSEIKDIRFHQNAIEKCFDVGHVSFSGKATVSAQRDVDRIKPKDTFVIYGIRNFSAFTSEFSYNKTASTE